MNDEIEFFDEVPQPPEQVKFIEIGARVYPDGRRVRFNIKVTPFLERPNMEFLITNAEGQEVASMSVVESIEHAFEMTAHLRGTSTERALHFARRTFFTVKTSNAPRKVFETSFEVTPALKI